MTHDELKARVAALNANNKTWKDRRRPMIAPPPHGRRDNDSRAAQFEIVRRIVRALYQAGEVRAVGMVLSEAGDLVNNAN